MVTGQKNSGMFGTELVFGDALAISSKTINNYRNQFESRQVRNDVRLGLDPDRLGRASFADTA
jgi:hypothetical protein